MSFFSWIKTHLFTDEIWVKTVENFQEIFTIKNMGSFIEIHKGKIQEEKCYLFFEKTMKTLEEIRNELLFQGFETVT